jgi:ABC-type multidrug transport system ATPase subunit
VAEAPVVKVPVIEAEGLALRFGRRWAFARVDLKVQPGQRLLIVGSNGSGKTTLIRTLATALRATEGTLRIFGQDPVVDAASIRARVGLLTHRAGLYEDLSALDNLAIIARLAGKGRADALDALARVGLDDRPEPLRAYSSGMGKRARLAAILLQQPELVLLDEPFAALDPVGMDQVAQLVQQIEGTVILASHQVERAAALCDTAMLLDGGLPRWQGHASRAWEAWQSVHRPLAVPAPEVSP